MVVKLPHPLVIKKAIRFDKIVSEFETKYHRFLVVKKKLNTFVRKTTKNKQMTSITPLIQQNVQTINHITHLAYLLLNFHFLRLLQDPTKPIKKSISQTDLYRVFSAVSTCNGKFKKLSGDNLEWDQSVTEFRKHINDSVAGTYNFPDRKYCCNLVNNSVKSPI